jgi:hypothetical protein
MPKKCSYVLAREKNIESNKKKLIELGLAAINNELHVLQKMKKRNPKKRKRNSFSAPTRRSRRVSNKPPVIYTPQDYTEEDFDANMKIEEEISKGWRNENGEWRGETFGAVNGVPIGTVFGAGDYQRQGRFEMSKTGFFKPTVTPEWIDTLTKEVYSIIVNNDNGLSVDKGDVILCMFRNYLILFDTP